MFNVKISFNLNKNISSMKLRLDQEDQLKAFNVPFSQQGAVNVISLSKYRKKPSPIPRKI